MGLPVYEYDCMLWCHRVELAPEGLGLGLFLGLPVYNNCMLWCHRVELVPEGLPGYDGWCCAGNTRELHQQFTKKCHGRRG